MKLTLLALVVTFTIFGADLQAADWPQWRGPERTGYVPSGAPVPKTLPDSPKILWHIPIGNGVASPVVCAGKVFYLDHQNAKEVVHAADAANGQVLWSAVLDDAQKDSQSTPGPRCTPLVDDNRVYAQSCRGELQCLNVTDGKMIWHTHFAKDFGAIFIGEKGKAEGASRHGNTGSPLVDGDHLIAEVGGPGASLVCFDKKTGAVIWKTESDVPGYAAPIVATVAGTKQVIAFMADGVMGVARSDGKFLWRVPVKTAFARHVTTPVVVDDTVMVASQTAGLLGVKLTAEGDSIKAETAWTTKDASINFSSPVTVGQYLYGLGMNKNLLCIDTKTGKQAWAKDGFLTGKADKAHVGMIVAGENLLVLTDDGQLAMVAADPTAFKEIGRVRVCTSNWCNPAYSDGKLFLRDTNELICVQLMP